MHTFTRRRSGRLVHLLLRGGLLLAVAGCGSSSEPTFAGGEGSAGAVLESQVSNDGTVLSGEPWVAPDPRNPQIVLATWSTVLDSSNPANLLGGLQSYCGLARSTDGGRSWTRVSQALWGVQPGESSDPALVVAPDGSFYLACDETPSTGRIDVIRSTDGGLSWSRPVEAYGVDKWPLGTLAVGAPEVAWDRPLLALDAVTGELYMSASDDALWGRAVVVSTDQGQSWSLPQRLDPDGQSAWGDAVAAAGGVLAAGYVVDPGSLRYLLAASPAVRCASPCVVFETSADHGASWSRHVVPSQGIAGGSLINGVGTPRIGVAADPARIGRYAMLVPVQSASSLELWMTADSGAQWTRTLVLAAPSGQRQAKWWLAYSSTGALGLIWRTVHADGSYDVSAVVSADGGSTFGAVIPLTAKSSPPPPPTNPGGIGDDCACSLYLDGDTLWTGWGDARSGHREAWFGRASYQASAR